MEKINRKKFYTLLIFSLVLLINPNINVLDIMPDFVAWFILAYLFRRASDSAPYFEEARAAFVKLAYINLAKIPAFIFVILVRSKDTTDNNIYALASFSFAVIELIFLLPAIKSIFNALFHLGERTDAVSLTKNFSAPVFKSREISTQSLLECTYFFVICKTVLYFLPDMFLLTRVNDRGQILTVSKYYPYVFLISLAVALTIGIIWFLRIKKYAKGVYEEGLFDESLDRMSKLFCEEDVETKIKLRKIRFALTLTALSSIFIFEVPYDNLRGINILPHFIYGILLFVSVCLIKKHANSSSLIYLFGGGYIISATVAFIASAGFLSKYEYLDLIDSAEARSSYLFVRISAVIEFVFLVLFVIFIAKVLNSFILQNTGISPEDKKYAKLDIEYHSVLKRMSGTMCLFAILAGTVKCASVFINSDVQLLFTSTGTVTTSSIPWFNLIVTTSAIIYIAFTFYFISTLKDEVTHKYSEILHRFN